MATPNVLKISDGTTTVDFIADAAYGVAKWDPAVSQRRENLLGGRGPYGDVVETMEITVSGTSALSKLGALQALCDQVTRWERGEPVAAVKLHYQPTAGSAELQAVILGAGGRNEPMIRLPRVFPISPAINYIDGIQLRFRRAGLWLGAAVTGTSSTAAQPATLSIGGFTDVKIESPVVLGLGSVPDNENLVWGSYLLMSSGATTTAAASRIAIVEAELMTASGWTTAAESAQKASGNTIIKYTPTTTAWSTSGYQSVSSTASADVRRWGMFVNYRNDSTSTSWRVKGLFNAGFQETRENAIAAGTSSPGWLYLGSVRLPQSIASVGLAAAGSNTAGTISFDAVALMALDSEVTDRVVALNTKPLSEATFSSGTLKVDHRLLTNPEPAVYFDLATDTFQNYRGDAALFMRGPAIAAAWLGSARTTSTYWRVTDSAGTVAAPRFIVTQTRGYLTPE